MTWLATIFGWQLFLGRNYLGCNYLDSHYLLAIALVFVFEQFFQILDAHGVEAVFKFLLDFGHHGGEHIVNKLLARGIGFVIF